MDHIGEFQQNSTLLLELLTMDENSQPITPDYQPVAVIELNGSDGVIEVDNVTLEAMEEGLKYGKEYVLSSDLLAGEYVITYLLTANGVEYSIQQAFTIIEMEEKEEPAEIEIVIPSEELLSTVSGYVPSSDSQIASNITVDGNKLTIVISDSTQYNRTYRVVLDKSISSMNGNTIGENKMLTYTSEYKPLYASVLEVKELLGSLHKYFSTHEIYVAIRNAGQKSRQMKGDQPDANNSRYREMRSNDSVLFPTYRYVAHEAARILLSKLMIIILNGFDDTESQDASEQLSAILANSITLGDFSVTAGSPDSSKAFGEEKTAESPLKKVSALLAQIQSELKFWQDAMMGHNKRGYAKPTSASYRSDAGSPTGRDLSD